MGNAPTKHEPVHLLKSPDFSEPEGLERLVYDLSVLESATLVALGPVGVGKSSYVNTVASFLSGHLEQAAGCGMGTASMTGAPELHVLCCCGKPVNWGWLDTPGDLFEALVDKRLGVTVNCVSSDAYDACVDAAVIRMMRKHRAGCVVAMLSALDVLEKRSSACPKAQARFQVLKHLNATLVRSGMRIVVVLTKADLVDESIRRDVSNVAYSTVVDDLRAYVSLETGVPLNQVHVSVNLVKDFDPAANTAIGQLALFNVRAALHAARYVKQAGPLVPPASHAGGAVALSTRSSFQHVEHCFGDQATSETASTAMAPTLRSVQTNSDVMHDLKSAAKDRGFEGPDRSVNCHDGILECDLHTRTHDVSAHVHDDQCSMGTFSEACTDIDAVRCAAAHRSVSEYGAG